MFSWRICTTKKTDNIKNDVTSELTVALALVPKAVAFSFLIEKRARLDYL